MTKEQYLEILKQPEIPMGIWFEYYMERGGKLTDIAEFERIFSVSLMNNITVQGSDGVMKEVTFKSALEHFFEYYNTKFDL